MEKKKKSIWWFVSLGAAAVGGIVLGYHALLALVLDRLMLPAESVGIIGGADGPTAVYVTGVTAVGSMWGEIIFGAALLILGIAGCVYFRKKR